MKNATAARTKLAALVDSRTLDQISAELVLLGQKEYSTEVAMVTNAYLDSIEKRFPVIAESVWQFIESRPEEYISFSDALLLVRDVCPVAV